MKLITGKFNAVFTSPEFGQYQVVDLPEDETVPYEFT